MRLTKFHEVTNQIVLTGHNIGFGLPIVRAQVFDALRWLAQGFRVPWGVSGGPALRTIPG